MLRILDATAGNRRFWRNSPDNVVYIDIQKKLERKPTLFADNRMLPFKDESFHTIIFDPPHAWNFNSIFFGCPDKKSWIENHPNDKRQVPTYYGMDVYKSKTELMSAIFKAQKEFARVLINTGMLWLNWSELKLSLNRVLTVFKNDWVEHIRLRVTSNNQTLSEVANWWVCLMKADAPVRQVSLIDSLSVPIFSTSNS